MIQDKITRVIIQWKPEIQALAYHQNIIAINFGIQKVSNGFELCLSGHSWYDESGLWYFDEEWKPEKNYVSLGQESLQLDKREIFDIYQTIIQKVLAREKEIYRNLIVIVGLVDGELKRLK